ncbi:MAG: hypothetical protein WDN25_08960 [Acetobacteraceae bacterium]
MDFLVRLKRAYRDHAGIDVVSGLNPYHFNNYRDAAFTHYLRGGESLTPHLGISLWELVVLERICRADPPRSIFIVGNGLGWSAIALAMMNPEASVVVVEPETGIELTNRIAFRERLSCIAVQGWSPGDTARIVRDYCPSNPDFVLIDGLHSADQIVLDFEAAFAISGRNAHYLFHDIVNFNLFDGLSRIGETGRVNGMATHLLMCTPSGMASVIRTDALAEVHDAVALFGATAEELTAIARAANSGLPATWLGHGRQ